MSRFKDQDCRILKVFHVILGADEPASILGPRGVDPTFHNPGITSQLRGLFVLKEVKGG